MAHPNNHHLPSADIQMPQQPPNFNLKEKNVFQPGQSEPHLKKLWGPEEIAFHFKNHKKDVRFSLYKLHCQITHN